MENVENEGEGVCLLDEIGNNMDWGLFRCAADTCACPPFFIPLNVSSLRDPLK